MNTKINYRYSNDTGFVDREETVVVKGEVSLARLTPYLENDDQFIPGQVTLPELNGKDVEDDHPWHEIVDVELTNAQPTIDLSVAELLKNFKQAHDQGWDENAFYAEIITLAAKAVNGFFVPEPRELSSLTYFRVRLQSEEHGVEDFKHFNLQHAVDKIIELYCEALRLQDGIERTIGLVVNPEEKQTIVTIFRGHFSKKSLRVLRDDLEWACSELGIAEPQLIRNSNNCIECALNDSNNYDLLQSFLKQKELLVFRRR